MQLEIVCKSSKTFLDLLVSTLQWQIYKISKYIKQFRQLQESYDKSKWRIDRSIFRQAYQVLDDAGPEGLTQLELGKRMGKRLALPC